MLAALLATHALVGLGVLTVARRLGRAAVPLGAVPLVVAVGWALWRMPDLLDGAEDTVTVGWVPDLHLDLALRLDAFALLMVVLVSGIGAVVFAYAWHYFGRSRLTGRAAGLLTLFAGSMLGVVLADNLLFLYVCWELTSITSYLLIALDDEEEEARGAALHALLVTSLGGLAMLGGFVLLGLEAGTFTLSALLDSPPTGTTTSVALVLILLGAFTKSAQYPFHSWLPGAMVAPTPISAYLHSAAMVKAGVYLVARLAPAFADVGIWRPLTVTVGLVTMIAGGLRALRPFDLKQLLAFGTISQLGFLMVLFGIGQPEATAAGCALLLAHGLFKAALFMVVGIVDHEVHTRDLRDLPRLGRAWRPVTVLATVSAASMAAVPPLAGFLAKEEAYGALVHGSGGDRLVLAGVVVGSVLTFAYGARFVAALVRPDLIAPAAERTAHDHAPAAGFVAPVAVLGLATVVLGVAPRLWSPLVDHAAQVLDAESGTHLTLWHGITSPLVLSALTLAAGAAVFTARGPVGALQERWRLRRTGEDGYHAVVHGTQRGAALVTSVAQSGSLPIYVAVIVGTAAVVPGLALVTGAWWPGWPELLGGPAHLPVAALLAGGALAATVAARRFAAALLLGLVGYGMAVLFVIQGAPDLALTQFAIETLSVVVFLLVLRRLPDRFERRAPAVSGLYRVTVSALVGAFVVVMGIAASGARTADPVSEEMVAQALPEGDGRNIVNVILVDIRGMDTLGEVTVLATAAIGITALARAGRSPRTARSAQPAAPSATGEAS